MSSEQKVAKLPQPQALKLPLEDERETPEWPAGILLSKRDRLTCAVPDDLRVVLTAEAFQQLFGYAYATDSEISCLGAVRREGNLFIVERFYLVKQEGGAAHTEMDDTALAELVEKLLADGKVEEARSIKCWAHSHPRMNVFWSKTDDDTSQRLATDWLVSLVVSDGFAIRARLDTNSPFPFTVDNVPVVLETACNQARLAAYVAEVKAKVTAEPRGVFLLSDMRSGPFSPPLEVYCETCQRYHSPDKCPAEDVLWEPLDGVEDWYLSEGQADGHPQAGQEDDFDLY